MPLQYGVLIPGMTALGTTCYKQPNRQQLTALLFLILFVYTYLSVLCSPQELFFYFFSIFILLCTYEHIMVCLKSSTTSNKNESCDASYIDKLIYYTAVSTSYRNIVRIEESFTVTMVSLLRYTTINTLLSIVHQTK